MQVFELGLLFWTNSYMQVFELGLLFWTNLLYAGIELGLLAMLEQCFEQCLYYY